MIDPFAELLTELGGYLGTPLNPDDFDSCAIVVNDSLLVQLEMQQEGEKLIMGTKLGLLQPGKYRVEFLKMALKANHSNYPDLGILGYHPRDHLLALYDAIRLSILSGETLFHYFNFFVAKAVRWQEAIGSGRSPDELFSQLIAPTKTPFIR